MTLEYKTKGTCSRQIKIETEGDIVKSVEFVGGCSGNTPVSYTHLGQPVHDCHIGPGRSG